MLTAFAASAPALASFDMDYCPRGHAGCFIVSPPVLAINTDTRDNLLRLVDEAKNFTPLRQPVPADITRSRDFYFGIHMDNPSSQPPTAPTTAETSVESTLHQQMTALGLDPDAATDAVLQRMTAQGADLREASNATVQQDELENRFVSRNDETLSDFFAALLADTSLSHEQRRALAKARMAVNGTEASEQTVKALIPARIGSTGGSGAYLHGANAFYAGDFDAAGQTFTALKTSQQPWLAETASYMLMRNALNASSANANGDYGDFDVHKVDKARTAGAGRRRKLPENLGRQAAMPILHKGCCAVLTGIYRMEMRWRSSMSRRCRRPKTPMHWSPSSAKATTS